MEPNKFEENIRTKFEERELQPSAEAWSKLEAQLGAPKSNTKTLWYAIAASLIAIVVVGAFLLKEDKTVSNEITEQNVRTKTLNDIDIATSNEKNVKENVVANTENKIERQTVTTTTVKKNTEKSQVAAITDKQSSSEKKTENNLKSPRTEIAQTEQKPEQSETLETLKENDFIKLKVDEVVAQVENLKKNNITVSSEDVAVLLQNAQRDIANQRLLEQSTATIDPASLLNDVENELERSFRDKVFNALGEGFNTIRTAVVERNN
jgi:heme exporter protein D